MWAAVLVGWVFSVGLGLCAGVAAAQPAQMSGEQIKDTLAGAILELDTPLGTKVPVRFSSSGLMAGEAGMLGSYLGADRDRGRWWVGDDRLCMKWFRWFDAETHCFRLQRDGQQIWWQEQSGRNGTATVAGRFEEKPAAKVAASAGGDAPEQGVRQKAESTPIQQFARADLTRYSRAQSMPEQSVPRPVALATAPTEPPEQEQEVSATIQGQQTTAEPTPMTNPPLPVRAGQRKLPAVQAPAQVDVVTYRVTRVSADDVLNIRNGPSEYHTPIGFIEPNGRGIAVVGPCRGLWCPIRYGRVRGWVNSYYLAAELVKREVLAGAR